MAKHASERERGGRVSRFPCATIPKSRPTKTRHPVTSHVWADKGSQSRSGILFHVRWAGPHESVWVNTLFDAEAGHFQYVYFVNDLMVTVIDLKFSVLDSRNTKVNVVSERTALNPEANDHVQQLGASDRSNGTRWQKAINHYLEKQKPESL